MVNTEKLVPSMSTVIGEDEENSTGSHTPVVSVSKIGLVLELYP